MSSQAAGQLLSNDAHEVDIPGDIDQHIAKWCGVIADNETDRVAGGLLVMLAQIHQIANDMDEPDSQDEVWQRQVNEVIQKYALVFTGLTLGQIAALAG